MPVTLNIIESTTELGQEIVEVVIASASTPGPAGPGVPTGGTDGQVLTKASATDYDTAWEDSAGGPGGGAPTDATYLVTAAHGDLSAEVVVGATPGGELGGTWASPTVDATHSGSSHAGVQAAAEATAAAALAAHVGAADPHTGYRLESVAIAAADVAADVATQAELDAVAAASVNDGDAAGGVLSGTYPNPGFAADMATQAELDAHINDATAAHAASAVSADSTTLSGTGTDVQAVLEELDNLLDDHSARHEDGGADEISIQGLAGTPTELTNHLNDAADAHDASAISVLDTGANYTATDVEGVLAEIAPQLGAGGVPDLSRVVRSSNTLLDADDKGTTFVLTATFTQTFDDAATLGAGWWVVLEVDQQDATTVPVVTLDPDASELIDGMTTQRMVAGTSVVVYCDGSAFYTRTLTGVMSPRDLQGLWLWLDAADTATITDAGSGAVSEWADKSGRGNNVTEATNRPTTGTRTINGRNTLDFDGTNDQLRKTSGIKVPSGPMWAVVEPDVVNIVHVICRGEAGCMALYLSNTDAVCDYGATARAASSAAAASTPLIVSGIPGGTASHYTRGGSVESVMGNDAAVNRAMVTELNVGVNTGGGANWNGKIAEIISCDESVKSYEDLAIRNYLANKWGVTA